MRESRASLYLTLARPSCAVRALLLPRMQLDVLGSTTRLRRYCQLIRVAIRHRLTPLEIIIRPQIPRDSPRDAARRLHAINEIKP